MFRATNSRNRHGRVLLEGRVVHVEDILADPEYAGPRDLCALPATDHASGCRCCAMASRSASSDVPGGVEPFTERQIELVRTFADQAVSRSRMRGCSTNCGTAPTIWRSVRPNCASPSTTWAMASAMFDEAAAAGGVEPQFPGDPRSARRVSRRAADLSRITSAYLAERGEFGAVRSGGRASPRHRERSRSARRVRAHRARMAGCSKSATTRCRRGGFVLIYARHHRAQTKRGRNQSGRDAARSEPHDRRPHTAI